MERFHFLYLKVFLALIFTAVVFATDPYSEALLSLKSELTNDSNSLADWLLPSGGNPSEKIHACSWSGVKCNTNSTVVIGLDLSAKNLGGALPGKHFGVFTELVDLNKQFFWPISRWNLRLQNLAVLDAFSNSFSGPLPVEVSQLDNLKILNLAGSYFEGPIPPEYGSFKSLEFIHLAGNFLSGKIPTEMGRLQTVTHMEIGYNSYQGASLQPHQAPVAIPFQKPPHRIGPMGVSKIVPLSSLDLSDNQLSGPIPESFGELKNLRLLSLMYNEMNGTVPQGIAQLPSLDTLLIWNNLFSGSLPQDLGKNSKLRWVDVSTNNLVGSIPPDICAGGVLFKLILFSNNFTGSLSPSISNCSSLVRLRIEDNSFSGEIPLKFSHLRDITYVDFSRNRFTGGIPTDIFQASKLEYFNISNNPGFGGVVMFIVASAFGIFYIRKGSKGRWKMVSFSGLPQFTANDVLRSFSSRVNGCCASSSASVCKAVLPTGITVSVKRLNLKQRE
ncbi:hypothetical protein GH714_011626 [Hevea brasiliensis]|uniref:Leucine-rich repeat-containing N-terminal plant-type domain-containing protein n=1 Tax=Hevea brasiliensis TaxID=3981 RepID=A0A6A6MT83_HEVBR|nr:hypothetical protein GH714_011626 [Hevea brasiliensis]